jgi:sialic acid synthase SpsE
MRRSVVAARDIYKGELIKPEDIVFRRPGTGLAKLPRNPFAVRDIPGGSLISYNDLK